MLKRTEHFEIDFREDEKIIEGILMQLEMELESIINFLEIKEINTIRINVHPTKNELKKVITNDNIVGMTNDNVIEVLSPNGAKETHSYEDVLKVIMHEVVRIFIYNLNKEIPKWLVEGVSGYLAKQYDSENKQLKEDIRKENVPYIDELEEEFSRNNGEVYSCLYVNFLVEKYGEKALLELIKTNDELNVYGTTYSTISNLFIFECEMNQ
ncbi:basic secretory protein-like protein [Mycoplasmatota bacterium WC44]